MFKKQSNNNEEQQRANNCDTMIKYNSFVMVKFWSISTNGR